MRRVVAGLAVLPVLVLAACSGSSGGSSQQVDSNPGHVAAPAAVPSSAAGNSAAGSATSTALIADTRALIRTVELRVRVRAGLSVGAQADRADDIAQRAGGQVFGDDRSTAGHGTATLTLKIPPDQLAQTLTALAHLGVQVSRQLSTVDVTSRVADVTSRVDSARASIARLRTLYGSATKVSDVIAIEDELSTREANLESLEAQQRALASQTSMATVHLTLYGAAPPPTHHPRRDHGIGASFARGWHAFAAAAGWVVRALATALPFLVLSLLAAASVVVILRRRPRRPAPPVEPAT